MTAAELQPWGHLLPSDRHGERLRGVPAADALARLRWELGQARLRGKAAQRAAKVRGRGHDLHGAVRDAEAALPFFQPATGGRKPTLQERAEELVLPLEVALLPWCTLSREAAWAHRLSRRGLEWDEATWTARRIACARPDACETQGRRPGWVLALWHSREFGPVENGVHVGGRGIVRERMSASLVCWDAGGWWVRRLDAKGAGR